MLCILLLLQFLAHLMADYVFQPHSWSIRKSRSVFTRYHFIHGLIVFVFSWLLSFDPGFWAAALVLTMAHVTLDFMKSYAQKWFRQRKNNYFFTDQLTHLVIIGLVVWGYENIYGIDFMVDISFKTIATVTAFVFCLKPANILIKHIFIAFSIESPDELEKNVSGYAEERSLPNAGKVIGIVERLLVLTLILVGQFSAVGFLIAAKSILRFGEHRKNEYILIGTLLSFGMAIIFGVLLSQI
ncbi:MAG: DUF3307 domain-containing protein [Marinilabiliaceae bacterium]